MCQAQTHIIANPCGLPAQIHAGGSSTILREEVEASFQVHTEALPTWAKGQSAAKPVLLH